MHDATQPRGPFWLDEGCPEWCDGGHEDRDMVADRWHYGTRFELPLALHDPVEQAEPDTWAPETATLYLRQHWLRSDAEIWLGRGDTNEALRLTLTEACRLRMLLEELIRNDDEAKRRPGSVSDDAA